MNREGHRASETSSLDFCGQPISTLRHCDRREKAARASPDGLRHRPFALGVQFPRGLARDLLGA